MDAKPPRRARRDGRRRRPRRVTAAVRAAPNAERVLDVCGASGAYATEFAARGYETTLLDAPDAVDAVAPMLEHRDVRTRAAEVPAFDAGGYGLVFAADATSRFDPDENRTLVESAFDALEPGGTLALVDVLRDGSAESVRARVRALGVGRGDAYAEETYRTWLSDAGFADVTVRSVPGDERAVVVGRRPERAVD